MRRLSTTALAVRSVTKATADFDIEHSDHVEIAEDVIDSETGRGRVAIHGHLSINARHPSIACESDVPGRDGGGYGDELGRPIFIGRGAGLQVTVGIEEGQKRNQKEA